MVAQAAREIRDGERVFVGMRLPLIAFVVAKRTHAPGAVGLFELGIVREEPAPELLYTMGDTPNVRGAVWCARTIDLMGLLQRGDVDAGFIGGAEIDIHGNLNTTAIGTDRTRPSVQLPGSGGGADIASLARRVIVIMPHEKKRLRDREVRVIPHLHATRDPLLHRAPVRVRQTGGDVPDPGGGDAGDTPRADELVEGDVGDRSDELEIAAALADDLVREREGNRRLERASEGDRRAVGDEARDRLTEGEELTQAESCCMPQRVVTVPQAARRTGRHPETIRRWMREGKLRPRKVGTQHMIEEEDLAAFVDQDADVLPGQSRYGRLIVELLRQDRREH